MTESAEDSDRVPSPPNAERPSLNSGLVIFPLDWSLRFGDWGFEEARMSAPAIRKTRGAAQAGALRTV